MIQNVAKISAANAEILKDETFDNGQFFNPIQDYNGNWVLSMLEAGYLDRSQYFFSIITWQEPETEIDL